MPQLPKLTQLSICRYVPSLTKLGPRATIKARETSPCAPVPGRLPPGATSGEQPRQGWRVLQGCHMYGTDLQLRENSVDRSIADISCVCKSGFNTATVKIFKAAYLSWSSIHHGRWEDGHHRCFRIQDPFLQHCSVLLHAPHQRDIVIFRPATKRVKK